VGDAYRATRLGIRASNEIVERVARRRGSPSLRDDFYHPDAVAERQREWRHYYNRLHPAEMAQTLGYDRRIPPQRAPFNSHGQPVFFNGTTYITPDVDEHRTTGGWNMFDRRGRRLGTYTTDLQTRVGD
jgi:hypothetical protein